MSTLGCFFITLSCWRRVLIEVKISSNLHRRPGLWLASGCVHKPLLELHRVSRALYINAFSPGKPNSCWDCINGVGLYCGRMWHSVELLCCTVEVSSLLFCQFFFSTAFGGGEQRRLNEEFYFFNEHRIDKQFDSIRRSPLFNGIVELLSWMLQRPQCYFYAAAWRLFLEVTK